LGLAAPQIGIQKRVVYIAPWDVILVNPVVTPVGVTTSREYEECLSCPGMRVMVTRHIKVSITSVIQYVMSSKSGFWDRFVAMGLTARIVQHEVDHLDGILIASRLVDDLMGDADDQQPLYTPKRSKKASRKYTQEEKWQQ
jgi:peptide deformylase